jgi:hypothetical protein
MRRFLGDVKKVRICISLIGKSEKKLDGKQRQFLRRKRTGGSTATLTDKKRDSLLKISRRGAGEISKSSKITKEVNIT